MACGLPGLTSNTTASPEVAGDCGIVVDISSRDSISDGFRRFYEGDVIIPKEHCRARAKSLFDKDTNLGSYVDYFETLLK